MRGYERGRSATAHSATLDMAMCGSRRGLVALGATLCALASLTGSAEACVDVWSAKKCSKKANKGFCDASSNRCSKEKNANKCKKTAKKCQATCGLCSPPATIPQCSGYMDV